MQRYTAEETAARQQAFLIAYRESGSIVGASAICGVPHKWHQRWMREDETYAALFAEVKAERETAGLPCGEGKGRPRNDWIVTQKAFLDAYARVGLITSAAATAGIDATRHYIWLRDDTEYAARFATVDARVAAEGLSKMNRRPHGRGYRLTPEKSARVARSLEKRAVFLTALAETGLMQDAAKSADVDLGLIYDWIKRDTEFAASVASTREATKEEARRISTERRSTGARRAQSQLPAEVRESKAAKIQEYWTPERRAEKGEEFRERRADPEFQAKHLAGIRAYWDDPATSTEARRRRSETSKALFADPEYRERFNAIMRTPEMRARRSAEAARQWAAMTEEERAARMAPMHKVISGGHRISRLEAKVMEYLNDHDVPYLTHKLVGGFVADLYIPALKLDIEADGDRWHTPDQMEREDLRDASLAEQGVTVLRMSEDEIRGGDFSRLHEALGVED